MIEPRILKGFRDFLPSQARKRQYAIDIIRRTFTLYGFEPLETPAIEYEDILLGKYGDEGDKLMYRFQDLGKRKVALRYDQTVPLSRVVAQYQNKLSFPFKRYQIQPVWRAENPQKGRFREFMQCDIDTVGSNSLYADAEIISCILETMKKLGFKKVTVLINDRSVFRNLQPKFVAAIDKLEKIGKENVINELTKKGMLAEQANKLVNSFNDNKPTPLVLTVMNYLNNMGYKEELDYKFKANLARGLDYYTGTIIELIIPEYQAGSLGGGGRYDNLIGFFTAVKIPAVGFAFGFDRLIDAMDELNLFPQKIISSSTRVLVTIFNKDLLNNSMDILYKLRQNNINAEIYFELDQKFDKQLKYADKKGIPYVVIIGPDEVKKNLLTLRNMNTKQQKTVSLDKLISELI